MERSRESIAGLQRLFNLNIDRPWREFINFQLTDGILYYILLELCWEDHKGNLIYPDFDEIFYFNGDDFILYIPHPLKESDWKMFIEEAEEFAKYNCLFFEYTNEF